MPRYYVTMTWHNWPEGGSYGTTVYAETSDEAEDCVRRMMADSLIEDYEWAPDEYDEDDEDAISEDEQYASEVETYLADYSSMWHTVDCFELDLFLENHGPCAKDRALMQAALKILGLTPNTTVSMEGYTCTYDLGRGLQTRLEATKREA